MTKLYEIAQVKDGVIIQRGGIAASRRTVGRWIEVCKANVPDEDYIAVPANAEAISLEAYKKECEGYDD